MIYTQIGVLILQAAIILFSKFYLTSYMQEKGKNLATKQDIQEITRKTEEVQKEFKESFQLFSTDVQLKYDFHFKQYSELYSKLYSIIIQSEYMRNFLYLTKKNQFEFEEAPFIQIEPKITEKTEYKFNGINSTKKMTKEIVETPLSEFNKRFLCDFIIEKGEYAEQDLLKFAISYRCIDSFKMSNGDKETIDNEEIRLIREIVLCIVKYYNFLREKLKMSYNDVEMKNGIIKDLRNF